jgi:hypothetical protein
MVSSNSITVLRAPEAGKDGKDGKDGIDGVDGKDGKDGISPTLTNTTQSYAYSASGTTAPTKWYTSILAAAAANPPSAYPYLWTLVVDTYSDGKTSQHVSVSKNGEDGVQGLQGVAIRTTEWMAGIEYHNDTGLKASEVTSGVPTLDMVLITENGVLQSAHICKKTHTSTTANKPTSTESDYWTPMSVNTTPLYVSFLIAENAVLRFAQTNKIVVYYDNKVFAGMAGGSNDKDIVFWSGGVQEEITSNTGGATWLVRRDGSGYMAGGAITFDKSGIVINGQYATINTDNVESGNLGILNSFVPNYKDNKLVSITPQTPFSTLEINDVNNNTTDADGRNTISIGGGMQIFANSNNYLGVINFNRHFVGGALYNSAYYGFQLADISGNLLLSRFTQTNAAGGKVGIFTSSPRADFDVAGVFEADSATIVGSLDAGSATIMGALSANSLSTPTGSVTSLTSTTSKITTLKIGDATLTWDSDNKALKVAGGSIIAEKDVIALGVSTAGDVKTLWVDNVMSSEDMLVNPYETLTLQSDNSDVKIRANDDIYFTSDSSDEYSTLSLSTIVAKINELAKALNKSTI